MPEDDFGESLSVLEEAWRDQSPSDSDQAWWEEVSDSGGQPYKVTNGPTDHCEGWCCTCPHHVHRHAECKHIKRRKAKEASNG